MSLLMCEVKRKEVGEANRAEFRGSHLQNDRKCHLRGLPALSTRHSHAKGGILMPLPTRMLRLMMMAVTMK